MERKKPNEASDVRSPATEFLGGSLEGRAPARPKKFGSPEVCPPETKNFWSSEGEATAEPQFRQVGKSAGRQVGAEIHWKGFGAHLKVCFLGRN
ncbi:MAG: hypothetical protein ACK4I8_04840 [Armatimonadota bacterium]